MSKYLFQSFSQPTLYYALHCRLRINRGNSFYLFFLFWARAKCALRYWLVWSSFQKGEVTNGTFPWPQTILKQLKEWHVIVSCDQLGETLQAALHYSLFKNPRSCQTKIQFKIKTLNCENDSFSLEEIITSYFFLAWSLPEQNFRKRLGRVFNLCSIFIYFFHTIKGIHKNKRKK